MWSEHYWFVLEGIVNQIMKEESPNEEEVRTVIYGICSRVPCVQCRNHFKKYVDMNPLYVGNVKEWLRLYRQSTKPVSKTIKGGCCGKKYVVTQNESTIKKLQSMRNY